MKKKVWVYSNSVPLPISEITERFDVEIFASTQLIHDLLLQGNQPDLLFLAITKNDEVDFLNNSLPRFPILFAAENVQSLPELQALIRTDFMILPFQLCEFTHRALKLLPEGTPFHLDPFLLVAKRGCQASQSLTAKEFQILKIFETKPHHRITRLDLVKGIWGETKISSKVIDVHLCNLRKKLAEIGILITMVDPTHYQLEFR